MQKQQTTAGGETLSFDYTFDIPVEVAAAVWKYRHDRWKFELPGSMSQSGQTHHFDHAPITSGTLLADNFRAGQHCLKGAKPGNS